MLSVIIVTHESAQYIAACLESIDKVAEGMEKEVIVVDAGSTDETSRVVHQSCAAAKYIQLRNVGFAAAANLGAAHAVGDIVLFLNPDASLMSGALDGLEQKFYGRTKSTELHSIPRVGVIGGFLMSGLDTPERWQAQDFPVLKNIILNHWNKEAEDGLREKLQFNDSLANCSWVSGGALCIRRKDFENIGGFNELFFLYFEDVDLCRRMKDLGFEVFLDSKMRVLHQGGKSANRERRVQAYDRSQSTYFLLHRPIWEYLGLQLLRFFFRHGIKLILGGMLTVVALFGVVTNYWLNLVFLGAALAVILATERWPRAGMLLLVGSVVLGQSVRIKLGGLGGTVTDLLLPLILMGLFYAVVVRGYLRKLIKVIAEGWWILAAFLPGILLAWHRLPPSDFFIAITYAGRLFSLLLLIPFMQILGVTFQITRKAILFSGSLLAGIGFLQLIVLPSLPPQEGAFFSQIFLGLSGGGWDPHQFRLFSTWLDPNFMGMFFVICLALLFIASEKMMVNNRTSPSVNQPTLIVPPPGGGQAQRRRALLVLYWCLELIIFFALTLTRSRAAFLALGSMLVIYFFLGHAKRLFFPIMTVGVLVLLFFPSLSTRIFIAPLADPTVQLRMQSWQQAIGHFGNFPLFGIGYNAYGVEQLVSGNVSSQSINSLAGTDNITLLILVTTGVWGVTLLLFGSIKFMAKLINDARENNEESLSILLILVALFVNAQFIQSFTYIHLLLPVVLLIGVGQWVLVKNNSQIVK